MEQEAATVIGLGELLWDVFPDSRRPGGAPANVAFHAGQLGVQGRIASRVGCDDDGDALRTFLSERGLPTDLIQSDADHPTGRVTVTLSSAGQPSYVIHQEVAWEYLEATPQLLQAMSTASAVCFGTLAQRTPQARETIHRCLREAADECLAVYDVNLRQHWHEREWIERSLQAADVVKLNDEELTVLAPLLDAGSGDAAEFATILCDRFAVSTVCVTRGAEGCFLYRDRETVDVPGERVDVVDTVGAGDAFTAALIVGHLDGWALERLGRFANRIGGLVASRPGAMPEIAADAAEVASNLG